jgi:hypothetical protein
VFVSRKCTNKYSGLAREQASLGPSYDYDDQRFSFNFVVGTIDFNIVKEDFIALKVASSLQNSGVSDICRVTGSKVLFRTAEFQLSSWTFSCTVTVTAIIEDGFRLLGVRAPEQYYLLWDQFYRCTILRPRQEQQDRMFTNRTSWN